MYARVKEDKTYLIDTYLDITYEYDNKQLFDGTTETIGAAKYMYIYKSKWVKDTVTDEYYKFKKEVE